MAVARFNYRIIRLPLQWFEEVAMTRLHEGAALRLMYERALIRCDRTAACLLQDKAAAARARALHTRTTPDMIALTAAQRDAEQREQAAEVAEPELLRGHRQRFIHRHQAQHPPP